MSNSEPPLKPDEATKPRTAKLTAEKPLPKSGADTLVKIIKGYAVASNGGEAQINYKDVASVAGVSPTVVSGNNAFLLDSQILESPKYGYYVPSEGAVRFAREAAWDEDGAKVHLRRIVNSCWYGQVAIQNFSLRPTLTRSEMKRALAIKCGAVEGDSTALEFLMDFLVYSGLIVENESGGLTKGNFDEVPRESRVISEVREVAPVRVGPTSESVARELPPPASVVLHLHIHSIDELTPDHAAKVSEWLRALNSEAQVKLNLGSAQDT